jgi:hypothetical protein
MVRLGTKWASIISIYNQSASDATLPTDSARFAKSAESREGAIFTTSMVPWG